MLTLPISLNTFKKAFLGGDGNLEVHTDQDIWGTLVANGGRFTPAVDSVADLKISVGAQTPLSLGAASTIKIGVSATAEAIHQISLIWPASSADARATMRGLQPAEGQLVVRLLL